MRTGNWPIKVAVDGLKISWLEPDVNDVLRELGARGVKHVVAVPNRFVSANIEVLYDLDIEALEIPILSR